MDDEDDSAAWHHADECQRRRAEDEALARHRLLLNASRVEHEEFLRDSEAFHKRVLPEIQRAKSR